MIRVFTPSLATFNVWRICAVQNTHSSDSSLNSWVFVLDGKLRMKATLEFNEFQKIRATSKGKADEELLKRTHVNVS